MLREACDFCARTTVEADAAVFARRDLRNEIELMLELNLLMNLKNFSAFLSVGVLEDLRLHKLCALRSKKSIHHVSITSAGECV